MEKTLQRKARLQVPKVISIVPVVLLVFKRVYFHKITHGNKFMITACLLTPIHTDYINEQKTVSW